MSISFQECEVFPTGACINNKRGLILGTTISTLGYGVVLTIFILCLTLLRAQTAQVRSRFHNNLLRIYICVLFTINTVATALAIYATTDALVDRTCPSPDEIPVSPYFGKANIVYCLLNLCSDALLIWRCTVIFNSSRVSPWVYLGIPSFFLVSSLGVGIPSVVLSTMKRTPFADLLLMIYVLITLATNTVITTMIVTRLLLHRKRVAKLLGCASQYTGIINILIESALLIIIVDVFFVASFAVYSWSAAIAFQMWIQVQAIAPMLIIFRVAQGKAWSRSTGDVMTTSQPIILVSQETSIHKCRDDSTSFP
ncbi:hypothetical protein BDQ12DRAFT_672238 [Crucibulum laeve]|uniref:G-protein coupled receptors family 1 profile domain-containing protein n=1 Tax=Crucibulum laeve TaxID=68775 RepID=A0A5C3MF28_9AGAR|nr:hypothetical protein BDQ12DRAFT_672238 [Crucibulum laeve]